MSASRLAATGHFFPVWCLSGYALLAEEVDRRMREQSRTFSGGDKIMHMVHNSRNCPVCKLLRHGEEQHITQLSELINHTSVRDAYRHSQGTCLWHLGMLLSATLSDEDQQFLLAHAVQLFQQDTEDMRTYAMKRDALRRALQNRNEEDAYRRAVIRMVGDRSVCMPWATRLVFVHYKIKFPGLMHFLKSHTHRD